MTSVLGYTELMEKTIQILKAMADQNRFRILMMLMERPLCVCEMLEILNIAGGTLSNHLKILTNADLINSTKSGRWIIYAISSQKAESFIRFFEEKTADDPVILADRKKLKLVLPTSCRR